MVESVETVIGQINRKSGGLGMPYVSPVVENDFKDRLNKCVDIIKNSSIKYQSFELEMLHADVVFVTPQYFEHDNSKFTQQLRRDYKELKI